MKKILALLTVLAICAGLCLSLASCKGHEHKWNGGEVTKAATCTEEGVKTFSCSCGATTTEAIAATGHSFDKGVCTKCGANEDGSAALPDNFYFTLADSLANLDNLYVDLSGLTVSVKNYRVNGTTETLESGADIKVNIAHLMVTVDENGNPVGKGEGDVIAVNPKNAEEKITAKAVVVLKDGGLYISADAAEGSENESAEIFIDLNNYFVPNADMSDAAEMLPVIEELYNEGLDDILAGIKAQSNSPINSVITAVAEYIYVKQATATGYVFTVNYDRILEVYDIVTTKNLAEIFDLVFGEGALADLAEWVKGAWNKDFATLEKELSDICADMGIDLKEVYAYVNTVVNTMNKGAEDDPDYKEFDVEEFIAELREMTVSEYVNGMADGEITAEQFNEEIDALVTRLNELFVMDMFASAKPEPDVPLPDTNDGYIEEGMDDTDAVREQLVEIVDMLKKVNVSFTTDKTGRFVSFNVDVNLNDVVVSEYESGSEKSVTKLTAKGSLVVNTTGKIDNDFNDVVNAITSKIDKVEFEAGDELNLKVPNEYDDEYVVVENDGKLYLVSQYSENEYHYVFATDYTELDGVACYAYTVYTYDSVIALDSIDGYAMFREGEDNIHYSLVSTSDNYSMTYYTIYRTSEYGEILKVEINNQYTFRESNETNLECSFEIIYDLSENKFYAY